jgi:plasmid replication initiation protein|tara:strand:- start:25713 stop:26612 length:900 start_codon:yes stop_codon:yes gene_type:complete
MSYVADRENDMTTQARLPVQPDLLASAMHLPTIKNDIDIISMPFYSIEKSTRTKPIVFNYKYSGGTHVQFIIKGTSDGIATIYDKDIILYLHSVLVDRMNRNEPVSPLVEFTAHDFLKWANRGTGKTDYLRLEAALKRLHGTVISGNFTARDESMESGVHYIESFEFKRVNTKRGRVLSSIVVQLSTWTFAKLTEAGRYISMDKRYLEIQGGIERRLYEIATRHVGREKHRFEINLQSLHEWIGSQAPVRKLKANIKRIIEDDSLPGYKLRIDSPSARAAAVRTKIIFLRDNPRLVAAR